MAELAVEPTAPIAGLMEAGAGVWVAGLPRSEAVAAVKRVIPATHAAELSFMSLSRSPLMADLTPGEIRHIDGPWRP
jgi:hypothetical protein